MMMVPFTMIAIASCVMHASCYVAAAEGSNKDGNGPSITKRGIIDIDTTNDGTELPSPRHLQDTCQNAMDVLFMDSNLEAAHIAYVAAEGIAFEESCNVPRDFLTLNYNCDVEINPPSLIDNFEQACVAAGGRILNFGGTPVGIECCGRAANGNFLTYGYSTLDQRACIAAECTANEARSFYLQGMFQAGTQLFQAELGLTCGTGCGCGCLGGCDQCPDCAAATADYETSSELATAKSMYYTALADAVSTLCLQDQEGDSTNLDCGEIFLFDGTKIDVYREACSDVGGILASSEPVYIDCSSAEDPGSYIRIAFEGTLTCVSQGCDLDAIETKDLIAEKTNDSPAAVFYAIDTTSMCDDTTDAVALCHGYITGSDTFNPLREPQPIPCGGRFGDSVFPSFQDISCCSGEGRYFVESGQIGGFDAGYVRDLSEPACYSYAEALSMVLCDPRQGQFITTDKNPNVLRICRSSCDMVFDVCGLPGENFPEWTGYTDGTSLCYELFGGFGSSPCESRDEAYVCRSGLTIEVITDDQDCLDIMVPTVFDEYGQSPDACADDNDLCIGCVVGIAVGALVGCLLLGCFTFICIRRMQDKKEEGTNVIVETPVANELPQVTDNANDSLPIIHAVAFLEPSAGESASPNMELMSASTPAMSTLSSTISDGNPKKFSHPPATNPAFTRPVTAVAPKQVVPLAHVVETTDSHNQATALKKWMQENPTDAAALTPADTANVLSKVTFSLNQASVAKELAVGIGGTGQLTCAHVVAAMKECSLQKKDVAECMAPHVNDPHNKNAVLNEIEFLSERNAVDKGFRG
jgi:hypothetical protein